MEDYDYYMKYYQSYIFIKGGGIAFNNDNTNLLDKRFNYKNDTHKKESIILCGDYEYNLYISNLKKHKPKTLLQDLFGFYGNGNFNKNEK